MYAYHGNDLIHFIHMYTTGSWETYSSPLQLFCLEGVHITTDTEVKSMPSTSEHITTDTEVKSMPSTSEHITADTEVKSMPITSEHISTDTEV